MAHVQHHLYTARHGTVEVVPVLVKSFDAASVCLYIIASSGKAALLDMNHLVSVNLWNAGRLWYFRRSSTQQNSRLEPKYSIPLPSHHTS